MKKVLFLLVITSLGCSSLKTISSNSNYTIAAIRIVSSASCAVARDRDPASADVLRKALPKVLDSLDRTVNLEATLNSLEVSPFSVYLNYGLWMIRDFLKTSVAPDLTYYKGLTELLKGCLEGLG
jgi:hypothetical protein